MARTKPTLHIDEIGDLNLMPENVTGNYIESKQQDTMFIKPPNCDSAGDTVELFSIRCHWERDALEEVQNDMLTNMKRQAFVNEGRISRMNKIQLNLRKRCIDFNSFLKDCDDKRKFAQKRINEELELQEQLKTDSKDFSESIDILKKFREKLKRTLDEFEPYERVMKEVVENSDILVSVKDCMDRCDALMLAQVEIANLEVQKVEEIEQMHKRMKVVVNDAASALMGLQNDLAQMERSYTKLISVCNKWEQTLAATKKTLNLQFLEKSSSLDGIRYMYILLCRRRGMNPVYQRDEVEKQLDFIKNEVELLRKVVEKCGKKANASPEEENGFTISELPC